MLDVVVLIGIIFTNFEFVKFEDIYLKNVKFQLTFYCPIGVCKNLSFILANFFLL